MDFELKNDKNFEKTLNTQLNKDEIYIIRC